MPTMLNIALRLVTMLLYGKSISLISTITNVFVLSS